MYKKCTKCDIILLEDMFLTFSKFKDEVKLTISEDGTLASEVCPRYIVYSCPKCKDFLKVSFEDYFKFRQEFILENIVSERTNEAVRYFDSVRPKVNEDAGIRYCGVCKGYTDGDGYCYNDLISICPVRRKFIDS